jgi:hypothetical protein
MIVFAHIPCTHQSDDEKRFHAIFDEYDKAKTNLIIASEIQQRVVPFPYPADDQEP